MDSRNVTRVSVPEKELILQYIFNRQQELLDKYKDIEKMPNIPVDLQTYEGQKWIKDFLWRITEELCEACGYSDLIWVKKKDPDGSAMELLREEVADSLHFIVETFLLMGWTAENILQRVTAGGKNPTSLDDMLVNVSFGQIIHNHRDAQFRQLCFHVIYYLGLAGNCLKNKPWKQTEMITDVTMFEFNLLTSFMALLAIFKFLGMTDKGIFVVYMKKAAVNKFRQESKY